jgi:hypothetical protein
MNVEELHKLHLDKLVNAFGLANAMSAVRDDRAARALGNHYAENGTHDMGKSEY